jgi:UDP-N-acetylmuramoyl-L-alanyl-D-glutamate--2,6-diaminopimelate ligase
MVLDRGRAIATTIAAANPGDTVLIAGKGHEKVQIMGPTRLPFDDCAEATRAVAAREGAT